MSWLPTLKDLVSILEQIYIPPMVTAISVAGVLSSGGAGQM